MAYGYRKHHRRKGYDRERPSQGKLLTWLVLAIMLLTAGLLPVVANRLGEMVLGRRRRAAGRSGAPLPSRLRLPRGGGLDAPWTGRRRRRRQRRRAATAAGAWARDRRAAGGPLGSRGAPPSVPGSPAWRLWTGKRGPAAPTPRPDFRCMSTLSAAA